MGKKRKKRNKRKRVAKNKPGDKATWGVCPFCKGMAMGRYKGREGAWKCSNIKCHRYYFDYTTPQYDNPEDVPMERGNV